MKMLGLLCMYTITLLDSMQAHDLHCAPKDLITEVVRSVLVYPLQPGEPEYEGKVTHLNLSIDNPNANVSISEISQRYNMMNAFL